MNDTELKQYVKTNLRITTDAYDGGEIDHLIEAAKEDIAEATGIDFNINNQNECKLVVLYVRGMFGNGDEESWNLYQERLKVAGFRKKKSDE